MLKDHYTFTVQVSRPTTTNRKKTFGVVATISAHIQSVQDTLATGNIDRKYNDFLMFSTDEVRIGDKLEDQNGKKYEVIGTAVMNFRRGFRHYESTLKGV